MRSPQRATARGRTWNEAIWEMWHDERPNGAVRLGRAEKNAPGRRSIEGSPGGWYGRPRPAIPQAVGRADSRLAATGNAGDRGWVSRAVRLLRVQEDSLDRVTANAGSSIARAGLCPRFPKMTVPARRGLGRQRAHPTPRVRICRHFRAVACVRSRVTRIPARRLIARLGFSFRWAQLDNCPQVAVAVPRPACQSRDHGRELQYPSGRYCHASRDGFGVDFFGRARRKVKVRSDCSHWSHSLYGHDRVGDPEDLERTKRRTWCSDAPMEFVQPESRSRERLPRGSIVDLDAKRNEAAGQ